MDLTTAVFVIGVLEWLTALLLFGPMCWRRRQEDRASRRNWIQFIDDSGADAERARLRIEKRLGTAGAAITAHLTRGTTPTVRRFRARWEAAQAAPATSGAIAVAGQNMDEIADLLTDACAEATATSVVDRVETATVRRPRLRDRLAAMLQRFTHRTRSSQ